MSRVIVEIRAAEGGDDAKSLVLEQFDVYRQLAARRGIKLSVLEQLPALLAFRASGDGAGETFGDEAGGHRWQRVPPNEKRGRVHTSTVTVAVLPEPLETQLSIGRDDLEIKTTRGSGPGGQHRNKTETAVVVKHIPTGLTVRSEDSRSQDANRANALALLRARLWESEQRKTTGLRSALRKRQVGSGMRGDKRRTIRTQDGVVTDHVTGRRWSLKAYLRGDW